jgi:glycerol-3-phosphate dehydrogenase (NAD(P)+)
MSNLVTERVAVVGGGSWATALDKILSENNNITINWWIRKPDLVNHIVKFRHNPDYLSDVEINTLKVKPSIDLKAVIKNSDIIIIATPAAFVKEVLAGIDKNDIAGKYLVTAVKGMIPDQNVLISQFLENSFNIDSKKISMISGPCHSEEVAMEKQSYLTIAGNDAETVKIITETLSCRYIKTSYNLDLYGTEYAAVMKNIYGIACGLARGLNYGDNFQAVLVSNAMIEMDKVLNALCNKERCLTASSYLGDLLVTAYSQFSRNRTLGSMVGRGYSVKSALIEMNMIAEGFYAAKCMNEILKEKSVDAPILKAVYNILYEKISPSIEFKILENILV